MKKFTAWLIGGLIGVVILLLLPCLFGGVILILGALGIQSALGSQGHAASIGIALTGILISLIVGIVVAILVARRLEKRPAPSQLPHEVQFSCAHCAATVAVPANFAGSSVVCGGCQRKIQAPLSGITSVPTATPLFTRGQFLAIAALGLVILGAGAVWVAELRSAYAVYERVSSTDANMKSIVLALHNYHKQYGEFPPAIVRDSEGHPLYSWRVLILPQLGEYELAGRFHYHEPWDSSHNKLLLNDMPQVFRSMYEPSDSPAHTTGFLLMSGYGTLFAEDSSRQVTNLYDGAANTVCLVGVLRSGVAWTEPVDMDFVSLLQGEQSLDSDPDVLNSWSRICCIAMFDGSMHVPSRDTTVAEWILMCRPDDSVTLENQP